MRRSLRVLSPVALLLTLLAGCGDDGTGPRVSTVQLGRVVEGTLTAPEQEHRFRLALEPGVKVEVQLQGTSGSPMDSVVLEVRDADGGLLAELRRGGDSPALRTSAVTLFGLRARGEVTLGVRSLGGRPAGGYRFLVAPLARPHAIGDTVSGQILSTSLRADRDLYHIDAAPGDELVFHYAVDEVVAGRGDVAFWVSAGDAILSVVRRGQRVPLGEASTRRIVLPQTGPYYLWVAVDGERVDGEFPGASYRFTSHRVNPAPEEAAAEIAIGDTVSEPLTWGDLDEFGYAVEAGDEYRVFVQVTEGLPAGVRVQVYEEGIAEPLTQLVTGSTAPLGMASSVSVIATRAGRHRVRVFAHEDLTYSPARGRYRFELYRVDRRPERAPAVLTYNAPAVSESLDRTGDVDVFRFHGEAGERVVPLVVHGEGWVRVDVVSPSGAILPAREVDLLDQRRHLPETGEYRIEVYSQSAIPEPIPFTVQVTKPDLAPETAPARIEYDVPVHESYDIPGDIDDFWFEGTEGDEVVLYHKDAFAIPYHATVPLYLGSDFEWPDPVHGSALAGKLTLPVTGRYEIRVGRLLTTGPYTLYLYRVNRRPETVSERIEIGDRVRGERLDPSHDVDTFVLQLRAGVPVTLQVRAAPGAANVTPWLRVVEVVRGSGQENPGPQTLHFAPTEDMEVWVRVTLAPYSRTGAYELDLLPRN